MRRLFDESLSAAASAAFETSQGEATGRILASLLALTLVVSGAGCSKKAKSWKDPSKHRIQFVAVQDGVRLEVLDWGTAGRPVVLLAGLGNTAHVFDDFADKLSDTCHVYGITRRGYGASDRPESGYTAHHLVDDILQVLDSLKLIAPVMVGHSIAGQELTILGSLHSNRIAGLVYLEALGEPFLNHPKYDALRKDLPAAMLNPMTPSLADLRSLQAYREWQTRANGIAFPEAELRNSFDLMPDGRIGAFRTPRNIAHAIIAGAQETGDVRIPIPVLALVALPASVNDQLQRYRVQGDQQRKAVEQVHEADLDWIKECLRNLQRSTSRARVVELPGANHFVFLSNETDVLRELRSFVLGL